MARIEMLRDFDWRVPDAKSPTFIAYKKGETYTVKRQCATDAVDAGAACEVPGGSSSEPETEEEPAAV